MKNSDHLDISLIFLNVDRLTSGRAMLRFFNRTPEELHTQANVSYVLSRTIIPNEKKGEDCEESSVNESRNSQAKPDCWPKENVEKKQEENKEQSRASVNEEGKKTEKRPVLEKAKQNNVTEEPQRINKDKTTNEDKNVTENRLTANEDVQTDLEGVEKKVILVSF